MLCHALMLRLVSALYYNLVTSTSTEASIKAGYRWSTAAFNTSHRRLLSVRARSRVRVSPYDIIGSHLWKKVLEIPATICQKYFIHPSEGQNLPLSHARAKWSETFTTICNQTELYMWATGHKTVVAFYFFFTTASLNAKVQECLTSSFSSDRVDKNCLRFSSAHLFGVRHCGFSRFNLSGLQTTEKKDKLVNWDATRVPFDDGKKLVSY